jgi:hypothetical protein
LSIQTEIHYFNGKPKTNIGKAVRNASFLNQQESFENKRQLVLQTIIQHPEGITDHEIAVETGLYLSCVNGRRNELMQEGLVIAIGIASYIENGHNYVRTLWGCS